MNWIFRPGRQSDKEAILELIRSERGAVLEPCGDVRWFVVESTKEIVACGALVLEGSEAVLSAIVIRPDWRGKLPLRILLRRMVSEAQFLGAEKLRAITHLWEWLKVFGFEITERDMQKELASTRVESLKTFPLLHEAELRIS